MYNSYLLPISSLRGFAQAEVCDVKKGSKHQLLVQRDRAPNFQFKFLNKDREIVVYLKKANQCLNDDFDNFIKVGVYLESDLDCILRALKVLFPKMTIFLVCPTKLYQLWKIKFRDVLLVEEAEIFG